MNTTAICLFFSRENRDDHEVEKSPRAGHSAAPYPGGAAALHFLYQLLHCDKIGCQIAKNTDLYREQTMLITTNTRPSSSMAGNLIRAMHAWQA